MARGWESKSVEDQISAAEAGKSASRGQEMSPDERARHAKKEDLLLSRARIVQDLEVVRDERHKALLERSLEFVDAELALLRS